MRITGKIGCVYVLLVAALGGCASVTTHVTLLDPAQKFTPTQNVAILLEMPPRPHVKLALIEAQGSGCAR